MQLTSTDSRTTKLIAQINEYFADDVEAGSLLSLAAATTIQNSPKTPSLAANEENNGANIQPESSDDVVVVKIVRKHRLGSIGTSRKITQSVSKKLSSLVLESKITKTRSVKPRARVISPLNTARKNDDSSKS